MLLCSKASVIERLIWQDEREWCTSEHYIIWCHWWNQFCKRTMMYRPIIGSNSACNAHVSDNMHCGQVWMHDHRTVSRVSRVLNWLNMTQLLWMSCQELVWSGCSGRCDVRGIFIFLVGLDRIWWYTMLRKVWHWMKALPDNWVENKERKVQKDFYFKRHTQTRQMHPEKRIKRSEQWVVTPPQKCPCTTGLEHY